MKKTAARNSSKTSVDSRDGSDAAERRWAWVLLPSIAVFELAWFAWFETIYLPNYDRIQRFVFLVRALPEVVPGVTFAQSFFGMAIKELSHVETLPQRLPIVLAAGLTLVAALSLGGLGLRLLGLTSVLTKLERWPLAFGVGAPSLGVITLVLGRLGWLAPWPVRIGLGTIAATEGVCFVNEMLRRERKVDEPRRSNWLPIVGFIALAGPFLWLMALGSMLPSIDFDAIEYHLQGPKEWFHAGQIIFLPHNVYTSMPFNVEMFHLLGMYVFDDWWWGALAGQLLVAAHATLAALMIAATARRFASPRAAWFAAVAYLTTPWIYRLAALPYVEGPLCYYHAALVLVAARAWTEIDPRLRTRFWALAGFLAGGAMACKYPALISAVIPFGAIALIDSVRRRSPSALLAFSVAWAVVISPWLIKNVIDTGNPVYPLAYKVFGGRYWDPAMDRKWSNVHGPRSITAGQLWTSIVDVAGRSDWQSPLFVALAPLAFLRRESRWAATVLTGYVVYLFMTWWLLTHRLDRFWLPLIPSLAVLAGLGADWTRVKAWSALLGTVMAVSFIANLSYSTTALTSLNEWNHDLNTLRTSVPEILNPALAALDKSLPPDSKVLMVGEAAVFHFTRPLIYNTVFDDETFETIAKGRSAIKVQAELKRLGVTHVLVDWLDIDRFRSPGNYGFTDFVTQPEFDRLVKAGVLEPVVAVSHKRDLYKVR